MEATRESGTIVRNFDKGDKVVRVIGSYAGIVGFVEEKFPDVETIATYVKVRISKKDRRYIRIYKKDSVRVYQGVMEKQRAGNWRLVDDE